MSTVPDNIQFAGFARRLLAYIIDNILATFISVFLLQAFWGEEMQQWAELYIENAGKGEAVALPGIMLIVHISCFALYSVFFWLRYQGTPAQRMLKMRVLNINTGVGLNVNQVSLRFAVLYGVSIIAGPLAPIILAWSMFTNKQQRALHDLVASSVVVLLEDGQVVNTVTDSEAESSNQREF